MRLGCTCGVSVFPVKLCGAQRNTSLREPVIFSRPGCSQCLFSLWRYNGWTSPIDESGTLFASRPQAEDVKRIASERSAWSDFRAEGDSSSSTNAGGGRAGSGGPLSSDTTRREASVVLIDRTLDLAAPASHSESLLQRVRYHRQCFVEWQRQRRGGRIRRFSPDDLSFASVVRCQTSVLGVLVS